MADEPRPGSTPRPLNLNDPLAGALGCFLDRSPLDNESRAIREQLHRELLRTGYLELKDPLQGLKQRSWLYPELQELVDALRKRDGDTDGKNNLP